MRHGFKCSVGARVSAVILMVLAVAVSGCASKTPILAPNILDSPLPDLGDPPYILQVRDQLFISFWADPTLDTSVIIRPDGMITLPFIDEVKASGKTPMELDAEITRLYEGELAQPEVTVTVEVASNQVIYVGGAILNSGLYDFYPPTTLYQAIIQAGGFSKDAQRHSVLLIRTMADGVRYARAVDVNPVQSGLNPLADVTLSPYDVIFVPDKKVIGVDTFIQQYILPVYALIPIRVQGNIVVF